MTIKGNLQVSIAIVKAFLAEFWSKNMAGSRDLQIGVASGPIFGFPTPIYLFT